MRSKLSWGVVISVVVLGFTRGVSEAPLRADDAKAAPRKDPDVLYVATPRAVVDKMLALSEIKKGDVVVDLGCGDGRIVVAAAKKYGVKAFGYDIDPKRIEESLANVKKHGVEKLATIQNKDIFTLDLSQADVVTMYLLTELNVKLVPQLEKLKPGSRIVSHDFAITGYKPKATFSLTTKDDDGEEAEHTIYLYQTPLEKVAPKQR